MSTLLEITLNPEQAYNPEVLDQIVRSKIPQNQFYQLTKRSIDARGRQVKVNISATVHDQEPALIHYQRDYKNVSDQPQAIIIGAGPAGMFAALRLIDLGIKPILIERGKDVQARRRDLAAINKDQIVNPESNYCFGEGGAGTYSDGKLYTRSKKRGDVRRILEILVAHGGKDDILYEAHPHIGTNKLPKLVAELRESILSAGGQVLFDTKVTELLINNGEAIGVKTHLGEKIEGLGVILATGHSARDIFEMLQRQQVHIEAKPFALGVRIEHPQLVIDQVQYHCDVRDPYLPASSYSLVQQVKFQGKERGVFSFCMCPGGFIVPAATAPGELVVNGMSPSRRDSRFANSGIVVAIELDELPHYQQYGALAALQFQREVEQNACLAGGQTQVAPAQRMVDFVEGRISSKLNDTSYIPGLKSVDMKTVLPDFVHFRLQQALKEFGKKMKGYYTNEAQVIGVESRTSSPVRIPRDKESMEHITLKRLFPCGEGAGYAGGIVSAAMDGERCAEQLVMMYSKK